MAEAAPDISVSVSTPTAHLGDLVTVDVVARHPLFVQMEPLAWPKSVGSFEVYGSTSFPIATDAQAATTHFQATLQNFATGPQLLPALELAWRDPMGKRHTVKTSSLTVTIQEVPPGPRDKGDIRGIKGVVGPVAMSPWWWVLAVALVAALGIFLWKKRKRAIAGPPPPPPEPADVKALRKLDQLLATGWVEAGKMKEFHSALSDTVREYLEAAFHTPALERTTAEILRQLRKRQDLASDRQLLVQELLEHCDLVKFAKFRPEAAEALQIHAAAVRFVKETQKPHESR